MHLQQLNVSLVTDADFENRTQDYEINIINIYNSIKQCLDESGVKYNNLTVGMSKKSYGELFKNMKEFNMAKSSPKKDGKAKTFDGWGLKDYIDVDKDNYFIIKDSNETAYTTNNDIFGRTGGVFGYLEIIGYSQV